MSILKMKKLHLAVVRSQKDALLKELIRHGCVEFSEIESELEGTELESVLKREDTALMSVKAQHSSLTHAVALLDAYAPVKSKLLSAPVEVADSVLLDSNGLNAALKLAGEIERNDDRIKRIAAEESRQRSLIES